MGIRGLISQGFWVERWKAVCRSLLPVFTSHMYIIDHLARLVNSREPVHSEECPPCPNSVHDANFRETPLHKAQLSHNLRSLTESSIYPPSPLSLKRNVIGGGGLCTRGGIAHFARTRTKKYPLTGESQRMEFKEN